MAEMPISTIVVVILCLIVLFAVSMLLLGVWNPFKTSTTLDVAKNNACQKLVSIGCNSASTWEISILDFDANQNGNPGNPGTMFDPADWIAGNECGQATTSGDNLATLCLCYYNRLNDNSCKSLCGCESTG